MSADPNLRPYATDCQWRILEALAEHGTERRAAAALGFAKSTVHEAKSIVLARAARHGYSPDHDLIHPTAPGFLSKGHSTLYNGRTGEKLLQWHKTTKDDEARERAIHVAAEALSATLPRAQPVPAPASVQAALLNCYVITDYHMGMLAWHREGGADWDVRIAERTLIRCFSALLETAPPAGTAVIAQLGDFLHWDGLLPLTPTAKHVLDADGRFEKVVEVTIKTLRAVVDMALTRHETVHLINAEGNHDPASSVWLRHMFAALYENEPRVLVDRSALPYHAHQHGETMIGFHHGHLRKPTDLRGLFAAQFPAMWGATRFRYAHCGHLHHRHELEDHGMTVTQHRTLAARDAYAARGGWHAERKAECITYHESHGQVATTAVTPEMVG